MNVRYEIGDKVEASVAGQLVIGTIAGTPDAAGNVMVAWDAPSGEVLLLERQNALSTHRPAEDWRLSYPGCLA